MGRSVVDSTYSGPISDWHDERITRIESYLDIQRIEGDFDDRIRSIVRGSVEISHRKRESYFIEGIESNNDLNEIYKGEIKNQIELHSILTQLGVFISFILCVYSALYGNPLFLFVFMPFCAIFSMDRYIRNRL